MQIKKSYVFISILIIFQFLLIGIFTIDFSAKDDKTSSSDTDIIMIYFYGEECQDCIVTKPIIHDLKEYYKNEINLTIFELDYDIADNRELYKTYKCSGTPSIVIKNQTNNDYIKYRFGEFDKKILNDTIVHFLNGGSSSDLNGFTKPSQIPTPFGYINTNEMSIPVLTIVLGALDSINPCSFFILLFLLNLLLYARSRKRMMIVGGIFIFFSGFIYFLLMALMLNALSFIELNYITKVAGGFALFLGFINIKDFFYFKKGITLSISENKKQKLFKRMRNLVRIEYLPTMIIATIILAISANTYELACTVGLPLVYTDILLINNISFSMSYFYIFIYNLIYIIPLLTIVLIFVYTLGRRKLSDYQGRILKLISGLMMFSFGLVMFINPGVLKNLLYGIGLIGLSVINAIIISYIWKKFENNEEIRIKEDVKTKKS